ncbi:MAG: class I SAM-dependent methyltransferase [Planctomycetota bacterium]
MAGDEPPVHTLRPTTRFAGRAEDYAAHRPSYPSEAVDAIVDGLDLHLAVDVGAGTGIFSRLLAARGVPVVAIEPNADMSAAAEVASGIDWREGTAERTGLAECCADLVSCAQAFHWFEPTTALDEFHRILRPGGRLALIWNTRQRDDPVGQAYFDAILAVGGDSNVGKRSFDAGCIERPELFTPFRRTSVAHEHRLDRDGLLGRALSISYCPRSDDTVVALRAHIDEVIDRFGDTHGVVSMRYETVVYRCERRV